MSGTVCRSQSLWARAEVFAMEVDKIGTWLFRPVPGNRFGLRELCSSSEYFT